jgi:hypothetical protein
MVQHFRCGSGNSLQVVALGRFKTSAVEQQRACVGIGSAVNCRTRDVICEFWIYDVDAQEPDWLQGKIDRDGANGPALLSYGGRKRRIVPGVRVIRYSGGIFGTYGPREFDMLFRLT